MCAQAVTGGVLWGVDRATFRDIIVASTAARRERFEVALAAMPIFSGLAPEQRAAIAVNLCPFPPFFECLGPSWLKPVGGHF